jgi:hypothetical protein
MHFLFEHLNANQNVCRRTIAVAAVKFVSIDPKGRILML